jgi:hypothetical protein
MKNKLTLIISLIALVIVVGCVDDSKIRYPSTSLGIIPTVLVDPSKEIFDALNRNTTSVEFILDYENFGGSLIADDISIFVGYGTAVNSTISFADSRLVKRITSFPSTVNLSLVEICTALGLNINTAIANGNSFDIYFELKTQDGRIYSLRPVSATVPTSNLNAAISNINKLGYFRYRFFVGCKTSIEEGYYLATIAGSNRLGITGEKEVVISKQKVILDATANTYINFLRDCFSISDLTAGLYAKSGLTVTSGGVVLKLVGTQPIGMRQTCGGFSLFNAMLPSVPNPSPQLTFTINSTTWDASTRTLVIAWRDATNNINETTSFVKVRDL